MSFKDWKRPGEEEQPGKGPSMGNTNSGPTGSLGQHEMEKQRRGQARELDLEKKKRQQTGL
jgi:hypothetical protein